ncbi:MAG: hypothetical protein R3290_13715 [Acidimicrobiia bacterium]|nr:hypothetical protein [Acidimicrobiia bacterium]
MTSIARRDALRYAAVAVGGLVGGGIAMTGGVAAGRADVQRFPFVQTFFAHENPCLDEDIEASGTIHLVVKEGPNEGGFILHFKAIGTAVAADSRTRYRWIDQTHIIAIAATALHATVKLGPFVLASQGPGENILFNGIFVITIDPDGNEVQIVDMNLDPDPGVGSCLG